MSTLAVVAMSARVAMGVDVTWEAPPACPDQAAVERQVGAFLRNSESVGNQVRAEVRVVEQDGEWVADVRLRVDGVSETRTFRDPECQVVAKAAALVIAVAIDPSTDPFAEDPSQDAVVEQRPADKTRDSDEARENGDLQGDGRTPMPRKAPNRGVRERAPLPERSRAIRGVARAGALFDFGALPGARFGAGLAAGLVLGRWEIEVPVGYFPQQRRAADVGAIESRMWVLGFRGCRLLLARAVELPVCVGVEGGRLHAQSRGFDENGSASIPWLAGLAGAGLRWRATRWVGLSASASVVVPARRPSFEVVNVGTVHQSAPVSLRGALGFEVYFP